MMETTIFYLLMPQRKISETKPYSLCLWNISKDFTANYMKKKKTKKKTTKKNKTGLNEYVYDFSVDYNVIDNTTMHIIFGDFKIFNQIFLSPNTKKSVIIGNKHGIYELPHGSSNELISGKYQNFIEL